jgi:hypothetical protein
VSALFSEIDLVDPDVEPTVGFRLRRLEVFNWGRSTSGSGASTWPVATDC